MLSSSNGGNFADVALDGYSDWFIKVAFLNGGKGMHVSYGHGSPFVYATYDAGGAAVSCGGNPTVFAQGGSVLGITINRSNYGLFGPTGSTWQVNGNKLVNNADGKGYFSLAVLPDGTAQTLAVLQEICLQPRDGHQGGVEVRREGGDDECGIYVHDQSV